MKYLIWGTVLAFSIVFWRKSLAKDIEMYPETTESVDNKFIGMFMLNVSLIRSAAIPYLE